MQGVFPIIPSVFMHHRLPLVTWLLLGVLLSTVVACTAEQSLPSGLPLVSVVAPSAPPVAADSARYWSMTFDARRPHEPEDLDRLAALGTTHLTLIPFGFQEHIDTPAIRMNTDARWYSESDDGIRQISLEAEERGMGLILKPHVWIGRYDAGGQTRADLGFESEDDWTSWEADYRRFMLHYATLAQEVGADVLVVGTELARAARERPAFWRALIADVRARYDGKLTYAGNWHDEYADVPFWDALDYIGVQAYFPLTNSPGPPAVREAVAGWDRHAEALHDLAMEMDRPVLFTEIGYRSVSYAGQRPWAWPQRDEPVPPDEAAQAALYQAFFERFAEVPWFAGAVFWKWHPAAEGDRPLAFTPQGKAAEDVLRSGFQRTR